MHTLTMTLLALTTMIGTAFAGTIRVQNRDSTNHVIKLKCSGSSKSIDIKASTTTTYTFHSTDKECDIVGGSITFPTAKLLDGQKWEISGNKAKSI